MAKNPEVVDIEADYIRETYPNDPDKGGFLIRTAGGKQEWLIKAITEYDKDKGIFTTTYEHAFEKGLI